MSQRLKGGQTRAFIPTLWHVLLFNLAVPANKIQPRYTPNQLSLCTQTVMSTPLSIRREDESEACGEAFLLHHMQPAKDVIKVGKHH